MGESSVGIPVVMVRWEAGAGLQDGAEFAIDFQGKPAGDGPAAQLP
jgi:hypothetical protein